MSFSNLFSKLVKGKDKGKQDKEDAKEKKDKAKRQYNTVLDFINSLPNDAQTGLLTKKFMLTVSRAKKDDMSLYVHRNKISGVNVPIIKRNNFSEQFFEKTAKKITVLVGNEQGKKKLRSITFEEYLRDLGKYVGNPKQLGIDDFKDTPILTHVQYAVLPHLEGTTEFLIQVSNERPENNYPNKLMIVCTHQGTSAQIITKEQQKLYHNNNEKAQNFLATTTDKQKEEFDPTIVMIITVPLKYELRQDLDIQLSNLEQELENDLDKNKTKTKSKIQKSEKVALTKKERDPSCFHGVKKLDSEFMNLIRDPSATVRCTMIKLMLTDKKELNENALQSIYEDITKVYKANSAYGELLTSEDIKRITASKVKPLFA